jgi:hypothetical protein
MDPELRSVIVRYLVVGLAMIAALVAANVWLNKPSAPAPPPPVPSAAAPESPKAERAEPARPAAADGESKEGVSSKRVDPIVTYQGGTRVSCPAACEREAACGLRDLSACLERSCDGPVRKLSTSDFELVRSGNCAAVALSPCSEACWKKGECSKDHSGDSACTAACRSLVKQLPAETFREQRCVLESACADLPLCSVRDDRTDP